MPTTMTPRDLFETTPSAPCTSRSTYAHVAVGKNTLTLEIGGVSRRQPCIFLMAPLESSGSQLFFMSKMFFQQIDISIWTSVSKLVYAFFWWFFSYCGVCRGDWKSKMSKIQNSFGETLFFSVRIDPTGTYLSFKTGIKSQSPLNL